MNPYQSFQSFVESAVDKGLKPHEVFNERERIFREQIRPALVQKGANDTDITNAMKRWQAKTNEPMMKVGFLPKDGQNSRGAEKDLRSERAQREASKGGKVNYAPIIKETIRSTADSIGNAFGQGANTMVSSGARFLNDLGENEKGTVLDRVANHTAKNAKQFARSASTEQQEIQSGKRGKAQQLALGAVQSTPAMIVPMGAAAGGTALASRVGMKAIAPYVGLAVGTGVGHTQNYGEVRQGSLENLQRDFPSWEMLQGNPVYEEKFNENYNAGMSIDQARAKAHADTLDMLSENAADKYGSMMTAMDLIAPSGAVLGSGILKKMPNSALAKAARGGKLDSKLIQNELNATQRSGLAKLLPDTSYAANKAAAGMVAKQGIEEGLQGAIGEYGSQAASANIGGKPVDYKKVGQSFVEEGLMGAIMGGGLQSAAGHSPTALAKDVAKTLRNETNTLRSDEAKARARLSEAMQSGQQGAIVEAESDLQLIQKRAQDLASTYGQHGVEAPYFISKLATPKEEKAAVDANQIPTYVGESRLKTMQENAERLKAAKQQEFEQVYGKGDLKNPPRPVINDQALNGQEGIFDYQTTPYPQINPDTLGVIDQQQEAPTEPSQSEVIEQELPFQDEHEPVKPTLSGIVNDHIQKQTEPELSDFGYTPASIVNSDQADPNLSTFDSPQQFIQQDPEQGIISEPEQAIQQNAEQPIVQPIQQPIEQNEQAQSVDGQNAENEPKIPFAERFADAHLNNPSLKPKLINEEIASGRPRADVLREVGEIVANADMAKQNRPADHVEQSPVQPIEPAQEQPQEVQPEPTQQIKSFSNSAKANEYIRKNGLNDSHEVVPIDGLFEVHPKAHSDEAVTPSEPKQEEPLQPLDHGVLNVPLSKRGNIDAELDKYKADQAQLAADKRVQRKAEFNEQKAKANDLFSSMSDDAAQIYADRANITLKNAKKEIIQHVKHNPKKAVSLINALEDLANKSKSDQPVTTKTTITQPADIKAGDILTFSQNHEYVSAGKPVKVLKVSKTSITVGDEKGQTTINPKILAPKLKANPDLLQVERPEQVSMAKSDPVQPVTDNTDLFESIQSVKQRLNDADETLTLDDVKASYKNILDNEPALRQQLSKKTKAGLLDELDHWSRERYKNEKKDVIVNKVVDRLYQSLNFASDVDSFVYGDKRGTGQRIYEDHIEQATPEQFTNYLAEQKKRIAEYQAEREKLKAGIENPKTLHDFVNSFRSSGKTNFKDWYRGLPEEQQKNYDDLKAESDRNEYEAAQRAAIKAKQFQAASQSVAKDNAATLFEGKHTKKGHNIWTVQLNDRTGSDEFAALRTKARELGGYYSNYRGGGAVTGFVFDNKESASSFMDYVSGQENSSKSVDLDAALDQQIEAENKEQPENRTAESLRTRAQKLIEKATASLNQERKTNTPKRAGEAARAEQKANYEMAIANSMANIAEGLEKGEIKHLTKLSARTEVETLDRILNRASRDERDAKGAVESIVSNASIPYVEYPHYRLSSDTWIDIGHELSKRGYKKLGDSIKRNASLHLDKQYVKWVKEKATGKGDKPSSRAPEISELVARTKEGAVAVYKSAKQAELVAENANSKLDKPIYTTLQMNRGEHLVLLNHEAALDKSLWTPNLDQRQVALSDEIGQKVYTAYKNIQKEKNETLPYDHYIEFLHSENSRLKKLGIHTPAALRAALREYLSVKGKEKGLDPIKAKERSMIGRQNDGLDFFPTPKSVVEKMVDLAHIQPNQRVLEPSAGWGHIADILKEQGINVDTVELSPSRRELLELKGHNIVGEDFLAFNPDEKYDRIIMNPPFSDRRDAEHIYHAFNLLKDDGVLVAIAGEGLFFGSDKKAKAFREWIEENNAEVEDLPAGTFNDSSLPVNTSVKSRLVKIEKTADSVQPPESRNSRSTAESPLTGSSVEEVRNTLASKFGEATIKKLEDSGVLTVIPTYEEKGVEGFAEAGKVTLVADHINSENAAAVFLHELGGHVGFQQLLKPNVYKNLLDNFHSLVESGNEIAKEAKRLAEREKEQHVQVDEYLPYLITVAEQSKISGPQKGAIQRFIQRIISAVKAFAVDKWGVNLKLSPEDILKLAERMISKAKDLPAAKPATKQRSLNEASHAPFQKAIDDVVAGNTPAGFIRLGKAPKVWSLIGLPANARVTMRGATIEKVMAEHLNIEKGEHSNIHNLTPETLRQLPAQLNDPVAIFKSGNNAIVNGFTVLTELKEVDTATGKEKPVIAALHVKVKNNETEIIQIASVYGRSAKQLQNALNNDLLYWHKEKGQQFLATEGLQLPKDLRGDADLSKFNIKTNEDLVKRESEDSKRFSRISDNPERFSRAKQKQIFEAAGKSAFGQAALLGLERTKTISKQTGRLFNTMLHKALQDIDFKVTFDLVQDKINHVTFASSESMDVAPDILTQLETGTDYLKEVKRVGQQVGHALNISAKPEFQKDLEKVGNLLFETTLSDEPKVFTDRELREMKFSQGQIDLYRQARAAIDTSLDSFAKTTISNIYKHLGGKSSEILDLTAKDLTLGAHIDEVAKRMAKIVEDNPDKADAAKVAEEHIEKVVTRLEQLKAEGYMPLMRFGKYYMRVIDPTTNEVAFRQHFESEAERNLFVKNYKAPAGYKVESSQINELEHKLFQGVSPETVALFAKEAGLPVGDAETAYIKHAVRDNHALKRLLRRQGVDGFNTDTKRVLAAFVLSNARYAANQLYNPAIDESITEIKNPASAEDAIRLRDYALDTQEEVAGIKNFAFVWYMGASLMFGLVNLTQPILQTLPYLLQYSTDWGVTGRAVIQAGKSWYGKDIPAKYKAHYERARREGHLDPQNTWMLQGLERGKSGLGASTWQLISHASGFFAQASETVNRRAALFASLDVAEKMGQAKLEKLGFKNAYDFAVRTIQETQGIYNKGNRPRVSRGNVGSLLMMYKQFMISYVEQMVRMQRSGLWGGEDDEFKKKMAQLVGFGISRPLLIALGILWSLSGATGLPFARDILDVIETAGGMVGKPFNTEREIQIALHTALGDSLGSAATTALLDGPINLNPVLDVKGRIGMGDLIPATGYFSPLTSEWQKSKELSGIGGAIGGLVEKAGNAMDYAKVGSYGQAVMQLAPKSVSSISQGVIAAATGDYRNMQTGVKTNDASVLDGVIKMLDAQPATIAKEGRIRGLEMKDKAALQYVKARAKERYEEALESGDRQKIQEARDAITAYNEANPRYPITLNLKRTETNFAKKNQSWQEKRKNTKGLEWMDSYNQYLEGAEE